MDKRDNKRGDSAPSRSLSEAILQERLKEAESIDHATDRRGSEMARLEILKAALERAFEEIPETDDRFALILTPSEPARLWIDMLAYVVMDVPARTYRFIWNGGSGRKVLAESDEVAEIRNRVLEYVAGQIIARERQLQGLVTERFPAHRGRHRRRAATVVIWAFLIGILTGAFCLLALAYLVTP